MHSVYGAERVAEIRRSQLLSEAEAERLARRAMAERTTRHLPRVRVGRLVLEFGIRVTGFAGAALRPTPRKTA